MNGYVIQAWRSMTDEDAKESIAQYFQEEWSKQESDRYKKMNTVGMKSEGHKTKKAVQEKQEAQKDPKDLKYL